VIGDTLSPVSTGGLIDRAAVWVAPPKLAEIVAEATAETPVVFTANVAVVEPPVTNTYDGTVAAELLDARFTMAP
jgi:hypothetical protein